MLTERVQFVFTVVPMAKPTLEQLQRENERLRAENARLQSAGAPRPRSAARFWRSFGVAVFSVLAIVLLVAGNLLFWTGNTVVKSDRFAAATAPIIRDPTVQRALANYTAKQLYANVDVNAVVQDVLPERAAFLAPTIAGQLRSQTESALQKVLARPQFQEHWNTLQLRAHDRFINTVKQSGGDGVVDLNELYQQLSVSLKNTKLSFLADKKLPPKVGNVQVASGENIKKLHAVITRIDTWRWITIALFLVCVGLAIYLSRRRRRAVVRLALLSAAALFVTLVAVRIARSVIGGKVDPAYSDAAERAAQILLHPLVIQTAVILALALVIAGVAWLTGQSRSAVHVQQRVQLLFAGKLHGAVFGAHENAFTRWVGRYKRVLQWLVVAVVVVLLLIAQLTIGTLLAYVLIGVILALLVEFIGSPAKN